MARAHNADDRAGDGSHGERSQCGRSYYCPRRCGETEGSCIHSFPGHDYILSVQILGLETHRGLFGDVRQGNICVVSRKLKESEPELVVAVVDANCILQLANAPDMNKNQKALYRQRIFEHIQCFLEIPNLLFPCFKRHNQAGGDEFCVNLLKCLRGKCLNLAEEIKGNRVLAMQCFSHLRDFCREECNKLVNTADLKTVICSIRERSREESLRFFNQQAGAARAAPAAVPKKAAAKARIAEEEPDVWNQPPKQEPCAWEQELRPEQVGFGGSAVAWPCPAGRPTAETWPSAPTAETWPSAPLE